MTEVARIRSDLQTLARFGAAGNGVDRPSYSPAYRDAVEWLAERMRQAGLAVREDAAGNLIGRMGPATGPAIVSGSHIDSVPDGGIYDGTLGVLAALEVARTLTEKRVALKRAYEVIAFVDEEGAYLGELGCRAMTGDLTFDALEPVRGRDGKSLFDAMREYGLDARRIASATRPRSDFAGYVELHIEQGPVLEHRQVDIGVVTGIAGIQVSELTFSGQANHAGTTPVPMRRDAFRAAAETVTTVFERLEAEFAPDRHRVTYGAAAVSPGAQNVVPAKVKLAQEIRAETPAEIEALVAMTRAAAEDVAARHGVTVQVQSISFDAPARMSPRMMDLIEEGAGACGCSALRMPSGAGHDAQVMARITDAGMIFIPSYGGVSHNPDESSTDSQIERGTRVLFHVLQLLLAA